MKRDLLRFLRLERERHSTSGLGAGDGLGSSGSSHSRQPSDPRLVTRFRAISGNKEGGRFLSAAASTPISATVPEPPAQDRISSAADGVIVHQKEPDPEAADTYIPDANWMAALIKKIGRWLTAQDHL